QRVRDLEAVAVVGVGAVEAQRRLGAEEKIAENAQDVADIELAVTVGIASLEWDRLNSTPDDLEVADGVRVVLPCNGDLRGDWETSPSQALFAGTADVDPAGRRELSWWNTRDIQITSDLQDDPLPDRLEGDERGQREDARTHDAFLSAVFLRIDHVQGSERS